MRRADRIPSRTRAHAVAGRSPARLGWLLAALLTLAGLVLASGRARAADGDAPAPVEDESYVGVRPDPGARNPLPPPRAAGPHLVWTGFQKAGDAGQVFLQTTGAVDFEVTEARGKRVVLMLRGCGIHLANNQRKLDTRYFGTSVQSVQARRRKKDVEVVITLREPGDPAARAEPGPDGTRFVVLTFPGGG